MKLRIILRVEKTLYWIPQDLEAREDNTFGLRSKKSKTTSIVNFFTAMINFIVEALRRRRQNNQGH